MVENGGDVKAATEPGGFVACGASRGSAHGGYDFFFLFFQEEILERRLRGPVDVQRRERETREMPTTHS